MGSYSEATAKAQKILGDDAKVPPVSDKVKKAFSESNDAQKEFITSRDACVDKVGALDDKIASCSNALEHFRVEIEKEDFGLDAKKDAKKIKQAKAILFAPVDEQIKACKSDDKSLDELDRHLTLLKKYKPSADAFK
jgi:hypothetical protein